MLEKMGAFFDKRLESYDEHMLNEIESAREFYPFTADCLPKAAHSRIIDLGCGTGLELEEYFKLNPTAKVIGIDLAPGMLNALKAKFPDKDMELILGSYFDVPFGTNRFDAAVSVESLHHFTKDEKIPLYSKLCASLKQDGYFILTDYFADTDAREQEFRGELIRLKKEQGIDDDAFYHYDTPLTVAHEIQALMEAGFAGVEVLNQWKNTYALRAYRR